MELNFTVDELEKCFNFAKNMRGNHNPNIISNRDDWEIFRDDFRGKLGEVAVYNYVRDHIPNARVTGELDFNVTPRGEWDTTDIIINDRYYNVKSIKPNSSFLLVETLRYNDNGEYAYKNNDGTPVRVDGYILVRVTVEPDVQRNIFNQSFDKFCKDGYNPKLQKGVPRKFAAEILGGISHNDFWKHKALAPKGIRCDIQNLLAISNGDNPPNAVRDYDKSNNILQTKNYVIGQDNLTDLNTLLNPAEILV